MGGITVSTSVQNLFFDLCCLTGKPVAGTNWASQGAKWLVFSLMNELTNWFSVGSVDFHSESTRKMVVSGLLLRCSIESVNTQSKYSRGEAYEKQDCDVICHCLAIRLIL